MLRPLLVVTLLGSLPLPAVAASTHRLNDGLTVFVNNADGRDFTVRLAVRDINIYETGPREVLVKVYDPAGRVVVRKVIPDDGVVSKAFLPPLGAWDHEAWYYAYCYQKGTQPMIRWSAFSQPDRLGAVAKRDFSFPIKGGAKGIYRVVVVGVVDHYVTLDVDPALPHAISGHPDWIHGHGKQWSKSYVYVPKGTVGLFLSFAEYDMPRRRQMVVRGPDGKEIASSKPGQIFSHDKIQFLTLGAFDDQIFTVEVSPGPDDFLMGLKFRLAKDTDVHFRGERIAPAVFAPDEATARAVQGGAILHDGLVFWHGFQVRFHDWLKKRTPADFEVRDAKGEVISAAPEYEKPVKGKKINGLPPHPGFISLNGPYWKPPLSDVIMHHYQGHKNKAARNVALRDLHAGLRSIGPQDHVSVAVGGPFANLAYEFGNYAWHYWRPAWRVLQQSDAPDEVKDIVREAFLVGGDRLAFCRTWERVNGNSFAQVLSALRYCQEATGDPLQKELFDTYWQRFTTGGWGERVGVGASGPVQEGFAYSHHYGSYILTTWQSIIADLKDERFKKVYDGVRNVYSYTLAEENVPSGPWSARTNYYPHWQIEKEGPFMWKGFPGPDLTESVNGGNEWFAARRKSYYALTYHGRLSPKWESNAHPGQSGYGGGMLCQLHIPGKGPVVASTLNGGYGEGMDVSLWREFRLHTLAGIQADGAPFVTGDSEHLNARLEKNRVSSAGEVRNTPLRCARSFEFGADAIACTVQLDETLDGELLNLWLKNNLRGKVREAYEIIPYLPKQKPASGKKAMDTKVMLLDAQGKEMQPIGVEPVEAAGILIDRGGFGVRIELDKPRPVLRGMNNVVMIRLADKVVAAKEAGMSYRVVPFTD